MATLSPIDLGRAQQVRDRILRISQAVQAQDNVQGADMDPKAGEVLLSGEALKAAGKPPLIIPVPNDMYKDEVLSARVSFDPATAKPGCIDIQTSKYYDSSYGRSAEDMNHYQMETKNVKDGFLGLCGTPHPVQVYSIDRKGYWEGDNSREVMKADPSSGNILSYKSNAYGISYPDALKEMVTTPSGIGLTLVGAALNGIPGTLGAAIFGPVPGAIIGASAVILGFAFLKTRI